MAVMTVCAYGAIANPSVPPPPPSTFVRLSDSASSILWLLLLNVLINLFCYSALLLVFAKRHIAKSGIIDTSGRRFLSALICAVVIISLIGAIVDFYLLTQARYIRFDTGAGQGSGIYRVLVYDLANWILALSVIFLSILTTSLALLRLRVSVTLAIAVGFVIINLCFWLLADVLGEYTTFLTLIFGVLAAPLAVRALLQWYTSGRLAERA